MYADRYSSRQGLSPGGVGFALGASGVLLFGLSLTAPSLVTRLVDPPLTTINIPIPTDPPPPEKTQPAPHLKDPIPTNPPPETVDSSKQQSTTDLTAAALPIAPPSKIEVEVGSGAGEVHTGTPPHLPTIVAPQLDSRYATLFQPAYPSDERLAGHTGRVVVLVLIGTDGRVKEVRQLSAASTAFFEATRKQALTKWRFTPGTRDGVPVEAWRTMAVRFELDGD
ncbi:energy transducer TonB [Sphingomonas echinoides]|uniref:TonB family protein n=1 Tax=Sphingomonas echinoides TaxID=59803 RepID=A0ABU4PJS2_9SPHN|nr:energy transducer TonB [Sphingomonas echinoides]MDX5982964.1 TonB family protein [Sphingomonas echinoides]